VNEVLCEALLQRYDASPYSACRIPPEDGFDFVEATMEKSKSWLFLSTGGLHGTTTTLEDAERSFIVGDHTTLDREIGFIVVVPLTAQIFYGRLRVGSVEDVKCLRRWVKQSLDSAARSQEGNIPW